MHIRATRFQALTAAALVLATAAVLLSGGMVRIALLCGTAVVYLVVTGLGVAFLSLQLFGRSICRVPTLEKAVALTFDDGPDPVRTPGLLDLLAARGVKATFFCVGAEVLKAPEIVARASREGHLVGNHGFGHSNLTNFYGVGRLRGDIGRAQAAITEVTGRPPEFFRPPIGLSNPRVFRVAGELGLKVVGWSIRSLDTKGAPVDAVIGRVRGGLRPGAIILLHDGHQDPDRVLGLVAKLVDSVKADGYQFVRLDELLSGAQGVR